MESIYSADHDPPAMSDPRPPSIDPVAALRWQRRAPAVTGASAWLHEEVARRMQERLDWIKREPKSWLHWEPERGGLQAQVLLQQRYPRARSYTARAGGEALHPAFSRQTDPWWNPARWFGARRAGIELPAQGVDMLWANMLLHMAADPAGLIALWHQCLAVDGFVMFSCLGPDTLRELRELYKQQGWQAPAHEFTDMHDWGDMLVQSGFAEPVMDMERIELSFATPERLLQELRELGRNLHIKRFPALRGRRWLAQFKSVMARELGAGSADSRLRLSFEVVYGHAFKPQPRLPVAAQTVVPLSQMRAQLQTKETRR
jgi:malonyl-CoA O-methyltransferase